MPISPGRHAQRCRRAGAGFARRLPWGFWMPLWLSILLPLWLSILLPPPDAAQAAPAAQAAATPGADATTKLRRPGADWPDLHGGSAGWHYSALDEIDTRNVASLRVAWNHSPDPANLDLRSMPVAADGLIAYCSGKDQVWVLDGATGRPRWHVRVGAPPVTSEAGPGHPGSLPPGSARTASADLPCRGLALDGGTLYFAGAGGHVVAWNAASGELRWDVRALPPDSGHGVLTGPPLVVGERVVLGSTVTALDERALLLGLDARSGHEVWRVELVGGPGGQWNGRTSWGPGGVHPAGATAWMPGAYDPVGRLLYWGIGSPLPLFDWAGSDFKTHGPRPGDNLYTAGMLALDPVSGALRAWHQELPHEVWVSDSAVSEALLIDRDGTRYVVHPNRSGLVFVYGPGLRLKRVWQGVKNLNFARTIDPASGVLRGRLDFNSGRQRGVCPQVDGGFPGLPGAYSPQTGLWYKVGAEWCMDLQIERPHPDSNGLSTETDPLLGGRATPQPPPDGRAHGHLDARDPLTGAKVWTLEFPEPPLASLLATAGKLLFVADGRGSVQALDAASGRQLWHFDDGDGHAGGMLSYEAGGHQYLALVSGWDAGDHPAYAQLFGAPYTGVRPPRAVLRAFRLP